MVPSTEQDQVVESRRTAICPVFDVVRISPCRWTVAARESAAFVSGDQRTARRTRHHTAGVVGLAIDDGCDRGVAGQAARGLGGGGGGTPPVGHPRSPRFLPCGRKCPAHPTLCFVFHLLLLSAP